MKKNNQIKLRRALHTSEHILGQILSELCKGFKTTSLDFKEDRVRYDFKVKVFPEYLTKEKLEKEVNKIIDQNIEVVKAKVKRDKAQNEEIDLSLVPESVKEIQIVDIIGINKQACSGEHVDNTSEIAKLGKYKIISLKKKGANAYQIVATINNKLNINNKSKTMNTKTKLSTKSYKGARDFYPEDMRIRNFIFDTWKEVALKFGFEEWDAPFLESWDLYAAKTGEEIVNNQLYSFKDRGGRKIAIRPEKTPSLARMIAGKINEIPTPIKWFNIANCWRYEKPQRGRGREFFQFDCDILGVEYVAADAEVFSIPIEIMKKLGASKEMFEIRICNRRLAEYYLKEIVKLGGGIGQVGTQMYEVAKIVDSKPKISEKEFISQLEQQNLNKTQIDLINDFINSDLEFIEKYRDKTYGADEILDFFDIMGKNGYKEYIKFSPEIMRGLDYYTGNVIEQFDLNPKNNRSMYGGGRYDDLVSLFTKKKLTGVGYAMGDITLIEFLKGWNLIPELANETQVLVTTFDENTREKSLEIGSKLRDEDINTFVYSEYEKLDKQFKYADKKGITWVIIAGPDEIKANKIALKNLKTGKQDILEIEEAIKIIKK